MSATAIRALVRASWQEGFNRSWRFSPTKSGLWPLVVQIGLATLVIWRMGGTMTTAAEPLCLTLLGGLQAALAAFLTAFLQGRSKLYEGAVVRLIHLSPAPAQAAITAVVLGSLPRRAWSALLFTAALAPALPSTVRPWALPSLWLAVFAGGLLGQLAGVVALTIWVRLFPQALGAIWLLSMIAILGMAYYVAYLLIAGVALAQVVEALHHAGSVLLAGFLLLFGPPASLLLYRLLLAPGTAGEAYREGWLGLMELGDRSARPHRSRFPRPIAGPAGALAALVWLTALRNWMSLLRIGLLVAGLSAVSLAGPALGRLSPDRRGLFILGLSLGLVLLNYGEQAAALFATHNTRLALIVLAGARPRHLLLGTWLAAAPVVVVAGVVAAVTAASTGASAAEALRHALAATVIAAGSISLLIGAAAFDAAPKASDLAEGDAQLNAVFEQAPTRPGGFIGLIGSVAFAAAAIWLLGVEPRLLGLLALLPAISLGAGFLHLRTLFRSGWSGVR